MNDRDIQRAVQDIDEESILKCNKRTRNVRAVEPLLQYLNWPLQKPTERLSVEFNSTINGSDFNYILERDNNPVVAVDTVYSISDADLKISEIDELLYYIVTDGINYSINIDVDGKLLNIEEFTLYDIRDEDVIKETFGRDGILKNRTETVVREYRRIQKDIQQIESNSLQHRISDVISQDTSVLDTDEISKGADKAVEFILDRVRSRSFEDIVRSTENSISLSDLNRDSLVITVKEEYSRIKEQKQKTNPRGRVRVPADHKPDYIAFYVEETNRIEYISTIKSFNLSEDTDTGELSQNTYDVNLSSIDRLTDPIYVNEDSIRPVDYCYLRSLLDVEDGDIEFINKL